MATVNAMNITKLNPGGGLPKAAYYGAEMRSGGVRWKEDIYPTVSRMSNTGNSYAEKGQYFGYLAGCVGSAVAFAVTVFGAAAACAAGMPVGGEVGYVVGAGIGLVVGLF